MAKKKRQQKIEFSKLIFIFVSVVNLAVIAFSCVMIWRTCDLSPLAYLLPSVATEMAAATGFYYTKAKVENRIKLMKSYGIEPTEDTFKENGGC